MRHYAGQEMNHAPDDQEVEGGPCPLNGAGKQGLSPEVGETSRFARTNVAVWLLAFIALVVALHLARAFFVPLLFGILVSYALHPIVDALERFHIPRAIGAALVLT